MKAYNLYGINDLRYEEVEKPQCPDGWSIVEVKAAGICSSDIPRIFTNGTYHFPTIPGHEFSGVVQAVGNNCDAGWVNKKVGVFPLIPCKKCRQCAEGKYEMCENYNYIGSRCNGGFAELVAVPIWNLVELPENIDMRAAAMLEPLSVALHAIKLADIKKGCSVGIIGTGMIGMAAGLWAQMLGADEVSVVGRNEIKRGLVEKCGLCYMNMSDGGVNKEFDIVLEAVGTPSAIDMAVNNTAAGGTLIAMGNPSGDILLSQNTYWRILRKQLTLKGTWNSKYNGINPSDWTDAVSALACGKIDVMPFISHQFSQADVMNGLNLMKEHKESYCKVMTIWNE